MKKLQNNFTTPEQSKRLLGLGVPADSCDSYYIAEDEAMPNWLPYKKGYSEWRKEAFGLSHGYTEIIPCWSVGRLMEIYDICVENTESWPTVKQDISYVINTIVAIDYAVKEGRIDFSKLEE